MRLYVTLVCMLIGSLASGQQINNNWKQDISLALKDFKGCTNNNVTGVSSCNKYVGNSLNIIYKINDFYAKESGRYMLVNEISYYLKNSQQWTLLGYAYDQEALNKAQQHANTNKAVVAIYLNETGIGHLSVITPGELKLSGSWGYKVPNSTAFFISEPDRSYMDKSLSYSFDRSSIRNVLIYARNY